MKLTRIPLPTGTYQLREGPASNQQLWNMMAQIPSSESDQQFILVPTPGMVTQFSGGSGPVRGLVVLKNTISYFVSGGNIYTSTGVNAGAVDAAGDCSMATDGINILSVTNQRMFQTTGGATTEITGGLPFVPSAVVYCSGYFVVLVAGSAEWFISGLNAITWDPLDFATAEGGSTSVYGIASVHLDLWFFAHNSTEVWALSGAADFPFQRQLGGFLEVGTVGSKTHCRFDNSIAWLGNDRKFYRANGYTPEKISDPGLEDWLMNRVISDCIGMELVMNGQNCYMANFPSEGRTWVYSGTTKSWFNMSTTTLTVRSNINCSEIAQGLCLVGDILGNVMAFDPNSFTENSVPIPRMIQFQNLISRTKRTFMGRITFDIYAPVTTDAMLVQWSDQQAAFNAGRTITGATAQSVRTSLTRLGHFKRRLFIITGTPTNNFTFMDIWAETTDSVDIEGAAGELVSGGSN